MLGSRTQNAVRVRYSRRAGPGARLDSRIAVLGRHDFAVQTVGFVGGSGFSGNVFGAIWVQGEKTGLGHCGADRPPGDRERSGGFGDGRAGIDDRVPR